MALQNLVQWSGISGSAVLAGGVAASCGTSDTPEKKPAACGSSCGAPDKPEKKPAACGSACGAPDKPAEKPASCGAGGQ
ncbi:MAG: ACGX-repeat peptide [Desulfovibrio sp.]|nr:ACGX-repeat peptide [Desulfovibrio sp.]